MPTRSSCSEEAGVSGLVAIAEDIVLEHLRGITIR